MPMGNYVIGVGNYVIAIRSTLGNSVIVHILSVPWIERKHLLTI